MDELEKPSLLTEALDKYLFFNLRKGVAYFINGEASVDIKQNRAREIKENYLEEPV
eukprot:CAMPEP_0170505230 /NCGR_PEP_ID=MMETSP0208-20121228/50246_1 /TAXON_ID=197538 /ORGANISM="Strombidium inclinatum, Strain S3" /LENGTH=55 /DNA_ID=CAMNT_0010785957 /DNA_START=234 /DNA_END=398 /DNA_ORIENTATION=-